LDAVMPAVAILFPGQGSHAEGMDDGLRGEPALRRGLEVLGFDPFPRLAEGTRFQQPALFLCSIVEWERSGIDRPVAAAGHSLGEYAALVAAGAIAFEDAVRLVALRGDAMANAGDDAPGAMLAVLGGEDDVVRSIADDHELTVANDNAPGQLVLSGPAGAVDAAEERLSELRARARRLDVSGAFHSPLMAPAAATLAEALARVEIREPAFPVLSNGTAKPFEDVRAELVANVTRPVRWRETLLALRELGAERYLEVGPGKVLTGLVKRTLRDVELAHA
jgi:[acyl-carrier-protein] S-malonyltransferase